MTILSHINDAVFIQNQQVKTDSLKVADLFGRQHKNVIQKIESLDCSPEFTSANFSAHVQTIEIGNGAARESKYYEMTKDGFIFLVMGFTGATSAKIKELYINTFNQMADMLYNAEGNHQHIHLGATVQLKSSGPIYTVSKIIYDQKGYMQDAEVMWHDKSKLNRDIIPIACLSIETKSILNHKGLYDFWLSVQNYGLEKLNHSRRADIIALNMTQIYNAIQGLPPKPLLFANLMQSQSPHPVFMQNNVQVYSLLYAKNVKCWLFKSIAVRNIELS
ncbi:Rha family transcriptional regulator [Acinetobacter sp. ULE_I010]|uniref:Rha family transcriptional regulator n=1 Tax=Acinetobacter sp. ULE_I010 TaxID=3373065 RepID=UPI003AF996A7